MSKYQGTVKWFNNKKGFGFILPESGGKDVFVHVTGLAAGEVTEGQKVQYELGEDREGKTIATNVRAA